MLWLQSGVHGDIDTSHVQQPAPAVCNASSGPATNGLGPVQSPGPWTWPAGTAQQPGGPPGAAGLAAGTGRRSGVEWAELAGWTCCLVGTAQCPGGLPAAAGLAAGAD